MSTTRPVRPYWMDDEQYARLERAHATQGRKQKLAELRDRVDALEKGKSHPKAARSITVEHAPVRPYFATNS